MPLRPGEKVDTHSARELMDLIAEGTRICGDPGIQYHSTINRWHTCPNSGPINASNPCSEYMFIDDSACNLASLNLMKFRKDDGSFDVEAFKKAVRLFIIAQEILVDNGSYPEKAITDQQPPLPAAGAGLCQPRLADHEPGPALRLGPGQGLARRDHAPS